MSDGNCAFVLAARRGQDSGLHVQGCEYNHSTSVYRAPTMCQAPGQMQRVLLPLGPLTRLLQTAALRGERSNCTYSLTRIHSATKSNRAGTQRDLAGRHLPRTPLLPVPIAGPQTERPCPKTLFMCGCPSLCQGSDQGLASCPLWLRGSDLAWSPRPSSLPPGVPCAYLRQAHYSPRG